MNNLHIDPDTTRQLIQQLHDGADQARPPQLPSSAETLGTKLFLGAAVHAVTFVGKRVIQVAECAHDLATTCTTNLHAIEDTDQATAGAFTLIPTDIAQGRVA